MISAKSLFAVALAVLVVSCTKTETATTTSTATNTQAPSVATAAPPTTATTPPAPPAQAATKGAIASTDGERPGTRIDITELKRTSGGTVNLKFVIVNNSDKNLDIHSSWLGDSLVSRDNYRDVSGVHLIDPVNKKKYFVVTDAERHCVCSKEVDDVKPGAQVNVWAKFPAPPADVQKVTIEIPHFQPIDDVPIAQ